MVKLHVIVNGQRHHPCLRRFMPEDLRIAKVPDSRVLDHRIASVLFPGLTLIEAKGQALRLHAQGVTARVQRDHWRTTIATQPGAIRVINDY